MSRRIIPKREKRILDLAVTSRKLKYAIYVNDDLCERGIKIVPGTDSEVVFQQFRRLLKRIGPHEISIRNPNEKNCKLGPNAKAAINKIIAYAKKNELKVSHSNR